MALLQYVKNVQSLKTMIVEGFYFRYTPKKVYEKKYISFI